MIISDATAIITLININEFNILKLFIERVTIPHEVYEEISHNPAARVYLDRQISDGFIALENYTDQQLYKEINFLLDSGESAAIALALEKKQPLIIDEKKGRRFAEKKGLEIIGLVGIIRFLYTENKISRDKTLNLIDKLNTSDFRISPKLLQLIIAP